MSDESQNQDQATSSEEVIQLTPETYLDFVIETTKTALGLLNLERQAAEQTGTMTPTLQVLFDAATVLLGDMQGMAYHRKEEQEKANIVTPPGPVLTDRFGNPLH